MAWLASIVFLPVPTEMLGLRGTGEAAVRFLYIASVLANSALLLLVEIVVFTSPPLWPDDGRRDSLVPGIVTVLTLVVALAIGTAVPAIGLWAMLLLLASGPITSRSNGRERRRRERPSVCVSVCALWARPR